MRFNGTIKFMFDYNCPPLWLYGGNCGPWLVNSGGYFDGDVYSLDGKKLDCKEFDERLNGETELEQKLQLIYDIYCRIWDINEFPAGEPYIGFEDEQEKAEFFDACDYVIKRMSELFGADFSVDEYDERIIRERSLDCRKP